MTWTDERIEDLKRYWDRGLSCSQIATRLGGVTRNAVIGKVSRLGLAPRMQPRKPSSRVIKPLPQQRRWVPPVTTEPLPPPQDIDTARVASVLDLRDHHCRWPIGDPKAADFGFCGRAPTAGLPYCAGHARRAYEAPVPHSAQLFVRTGYKVRAA